MSKIQIRNPDALLLAGLFPVQGVVSYLWSRAYPDKADYYLISAVTLFVVGVMWAWRATTGEVEEYRQGRLGVALAGLAGILVVGLACWGVYTAQPESRDGLVVRMAYALEALVALLGMSYFAFGRRLILARLASSKAPAA